MGKVLVGGPLPVGSGVGENIGSDPAAVVEEVLPVTQMAPEVGVGGILKIRWKNAHHLKFVLWPISAQAMYVVNIAISPWAKLITSVAL